MQSSRDILLQLLLWIAGECPSHAPLAGGPSLLWIAVQCIVKKVALLNGGGKNCKSKCFRCRQIVSPWKRGIRLKQWRWQAICKAVFLWLIVLHVSMSVTKLVLLFFPDLTGQSATLILQAIRCNIVVCSLICLLY